MSFLCIFVHLRGRQTRAVLPACIMNSTLKIYKASAGSGKTFTLTVEYIYLMIRPGAEEEYMHTLAVTFTNKATAEMKDRILQHLYGISHALGGSEPYMRQLMEKLRHDGHSMTEEQVRRRSGKALTQILHDYSRFRVETIDSFFQSILRSLARELGQSSNLQVELNDQELLDMAVDRMIDSLDLDGTLRDIVVQYVADELDENGKWNIQSSVKAFAQCIFQEDFMQRSKADRDVISDYRQVRAFRTGMKHIMEQAETQTRELAASMLEYMQSVCTPEHVGKRQPAPVTYLQNIIDGKDAGNRTVAKGVKFQAFLADGSTLLLTKYRNDEAVGAQYRQLADKFVDFLSREDTLRRRYNTARLARHFTNQLQLLSRIDEMVRDINNERETFPLSRTPTLLSGLIDGQDNPFVFEKIGTVLRNVMIDEFQDTSRLQWNNFKVLLFENQSLGGTDLIVGDIKQSIYRWRGGEWSLLSNLADSMQAWKPTTETLDTNYRSEQRIVRFNNDFFTRAAMVLDDAYGGARFAIGGEAGIYSDVRQETPPWKNANPQGFYSVSLRIRGTKANGQPKLSPEEEKQWILDDMLSRICTLHEAGLPLTQMAILLRKNKQAAVILDYFQEHAPSDIRIASDEAYLLGNSTIPVIIISAMRTLIEDYESRPVAYHLLLMNLLHRVEGREVPMDEIMRGNAVEMLPAFLKDERERLRQLPLYELVEELYRRLHLNLLKEQDAYHYAFLDAVQLYLRDNPNDIYSFLEAWETTLCRQSIPSGKQDGIRILTIHKSKGLEFHTVFMPFCDWDMEADKGDTLWCEAEDGHDEFNALGKMPVNRTAAMAQSYYSGRYEEEHLQSRVDELNSLYVAFTRASCNLYVWGLCKDKSIQECHTVGNLLCTCLNPQMDFNDGVWHQEEGTAVTSVKQAKASDNRMLPDYAPKHVDMVSYKARLNFRQSNEAREMLDTAESSRAQGTLFHNVMAEIHDTGQTDHVLKRALMQGRLTRQQHDELKADLQQINDNSLIYSWFAPENKVFAECDILDPYAGKQGKRNQRPDRIVMRDGLITVIDYKFGDEHGGYKGQVRNYMRLLRSMYPDCEVKGYLWYVKSGTTEDVESAATEGMDSKATEGVK